MAGRGVKRSVTHQGGSEVKRLDTNSHEGMVQLVVNAVDKAIELDDSSRVMLRNMAPLCLRTPIDDRHEYQVTVGEMLRQALEQAEAAVYTAIKDAEDVAMQAAAKVGRLKQETEARRERLAAERKALWSAKQVWCEVQEALRADWRTLSEARQQRQSLDANLVEALEKKEKLEAAIESHFGAIVEGREIVANVEALVLASRAAGLDTGLVDSFDLVARKRPEARTPFEKVVLNEVKTAAAARAAELAGIAERGNPGTAERVAAEEAAGVAFSAAEERMAEVARHLRRTEVNVQVAEADALDAEEAVEDADYEKRHRAMDHVIPQWSHEQFRHGPVAVFQKLHGRAVLSEAEEAARLMAESSAEAVQVDATAEASAAAAQVDATAEEPAMEVDLTAEEPAAVVKVDATAEASAVADQVEPEEAPAEKPGEVLAETTVLLRLQDTPEKSPESPKHGAKEVLILPIAAYYEANLRTAELPGCLAGRLFPMQRKAVEKDEEAMEKSEEDVKAPLAKDTVGDTIEMSETNSEQAKEPLEASEENKDAAEAVASEEPAEEIMEVSKDEEMADASEAKHELVEEGAQEETTMEAEDEAMKGVADASKEKVEAASAEEILEGTTETSEGSRQG